MVIALFVPIHSVHADPATPEFVYSVVCTAERHWDCATALAIIKRESGFDSQAVNQVSLCVGWWQFYPGHKLSWEVMTDPYLSTDYAYRLWLVSGWDAWK